MKIIEVNYKGGYMVSVKFENGKYKEFDFYDFIFYTDCMDGKGLRNKFKNHG